MTPPIVKGVMNENSVSFLGEYRFGLSSTCHTFASPGGIKVWRAHVRPEGRLHIKHTNFLGGNPMRPPPAPPKSLPRQPETNPSLKFLYLHFNFYARTP